MVGNEITECDGSGLAQIKACVQLGLLEADALASLARALALHAVAGACARFVLAGCQLLGCLNCPPLSFVTTPGHHLANTEVFTLTP